MKKFKLMALAVFCIFIAFAIGAGPVNAQAYRPYTNTIDLTVKNVPTFQSGLGLDTSGSEWYVNSNASGTAAGTSWTNACLTIDACINLATASNGDLINVAYTHTETYTAANGFDLDKAGLTLIFHRNGQNTANLIFGHADATVACGAANNTIYGGRFLAGITAVTAGIMVEAGCDNFTMVDAVFPEPTTSTFEFVDGIDLAALADGVHIYGLEYYNADATGGAHAIEMGNGVNKDFQLINARIFGEFSVAPVWSNDADEEVFIAGGDITNMTTGQFAVEFAGAATGSVSSILLRTDGQATALDPGSMTVGLDVMWDDEDTADTVAIPVIAGGSVTQGLADVHLNHVMALDGATSKFPEQAVADSTICKMLGDDDPAVCTTYDNSTDSLEAISNLLTGGTATLAGIAMDNLMLLDGATSKFPENAVTDSTICKMLGDDDPAVCTTYDNSTDSLEAIGVKTTAIATDSSYIADLALPVDPTSDSLAAFIASGGTALGTELGDSKSIVDAIGADGVAVLTVTAGSLYGMSGTTFIVEKTLTSSDVVTGGVDLTAVASGGDIYIDDIIIETNATGLATGTNFTLEKNGGSGVLTFFSETVGNLGGNATEVLSTGSVVPSNGTVLESGQKIIAKCTVGSCDGVGTITLYIKARRVAAGANLTAAP